jgi:hypothetical protein
MTERLEVETGRRRTRGGTRGIWRALRCAAFVLLPALAAREAGAHRLGESYVFLQVHADRVDGRFEVSTTDLNRGLRLTGTGGEITKASLDQHAELLKEYFREHVTIADARGPLAIRFADVDYSEVRGGNVMLPFGLEGLEGVPDRLSFDYSVLFDEEPGHRGFLIIEHNWATGTFANEAGISAVFSPSSRRQSLDIQSGGRLRGFLAVMRLGIEHIWMGLDHVVFLVALLLPAVLRRENGRWEPVDRFRPALINVLKVVTAFTVAHTLTLSLAALGVIHLPSRLVESAIAVSVAIAAADILFPLLHRRVWLVVFFFGLFHGFGFAGVLEEMGVLTENLGLSLFGFNLGVEIGQVVIVSAVFPVLFLVRGLWAYRRLAVQAAAVAMIVIASGWIYERAFGVDFAMADAAIGLVRKVVP